jgi:hypothetical protein
MPAAHAWLWLSRTVEVHDTTTGVQSSMQIKTQQVLTVPSRG